MAGSLMRQGRVNFVVVGADRIAANGDTANKIGTYTVAVLARSTASRFMSPRRSPRSISPTPDGSAIPIEERNAKEVTHVGGSQARAEGASVWNPAFDVTPHHLIAGIITERGILRAPYIESLRRRLANLNRTRVNMLMLGIETSCDETAAAVVEETGEPDGPGRSARTSSRRRSPIHREWGGVVPELASRQHIRDICGVVDRALDEAGVTWSDLGAVAVTQGPGWSVRFSWACRSRRRRPSPRGCRSSASTI